MNELGLLKRNVEVVRLETEMHACVKQHLNKGATCIPGDLLVDDQITYYEYTLKYNNLIGRDEYSLRACQNIIKIMIEKIKRTHCGCNE